MKKLLLLYAGVCILLFSCQGKIKSIQDSQSNNVETLDEACERVLDENGDSLVAVGQEDKNPPFEVKKSKSAGFNLWIITENRNKVADIPFVLESCPVGIFDTPASKKNR